MFKITMRAFGIRPDVGAKAAEDIVAEFRENRTWHERVTCSFADRTLTLVAYDDYDENGLVLSDEFSDCLSAFIPLDGICDNGVFKVVAVDRV